MPQALKLRGRVRMAFGHSFVLTPTATELLRGRVQEPGVSKIYTNMIHGRVPGFVCASCGIYLPDFAHSLAILCEDLKILKDIPRAVVANRGIAIVCSWQTNIIAAELSGIRGVPIFDHLWTRANTRLLDIAQEVIGTELDSGIIADGGVLPQLKNLY